MSNFSFPSWRRYSLQIIGVVLIALFGLSTQTQAQCSNPGNAIVAENCLPGTPSSVWDINGQGTGDLTIQGFATDMSVNVGGTVNFKISTPASAYTIDIYRVGYYGGNGAHKVTSITPSAHLPQTQPACLSNTTTGLTDCGNWAISASWQVPATATSGVYFAHLTRNDTGGDSHIVFIVRNDSSHADILYQTSDTSWQAYNYYGNGSLYGPGQPEFGLSVRTFEVSYNRPVLTRGFNNESATFLFGAEFSMIQWLEANGYDVSYTSGVDTARSGSLILNHKVFMDSGHDEYVSGPARTNIQAARDAGVNLAFFSGNEVFWKTRWDVSTDGTNTPYRTMICYKETLAFAKLDPGDPPTWTGTWRDPSFSPPADGGLPENALTGTLFMVNGTGDDNDGSLKILVPAADGKMRFWRNTAVASLAPGASYSLVKGSLGYEWDIDADNGFRPAGAFRLSTTTNTLTTDLLLDYGATYGAGTATHHMMMYRAPSGALVFGAGTVDWAYGLNSNHDESFNFTAPDPDINMEQATVNLLADMGAQPTSLQSGLSIASKSTDTVPPHSTILSPAAGATVSTGSTVTISGTATDTGGVVAGIEVSTDNGKTWHPATTGRASWTYLWSPRVTGSTTLLSRAVDDTGNLETPSNGVVLGVSPQTCPCTIFGQTAPTNADSGDGTAVEVGVKFRSDSGGSIIGVRFYKSAANTGTHIGHLWSDSGQLLGTATFTSETASGWQQANFSSPIPATANATYVASYLAPVGHYSADSQFFAQAGTDNPPLHALANGVDGENAVFVYGAAGGFPNSSFNSANYWADVIFVSSNTYTISGNISGNGGEGATVTLTGPESLSTTSDGSGNFAFNGVVNGTYMVSVSYAGVTFAPPSQSVSVSFGSVSGVNFVATVTNPLSISGTITGGAGATVSLAGPYSATTTADGSGNYSFGGLLGGSYTVTPSQPGFIFIPSTQTILLSGMSAVNVNFQGQVCTCISIWKPTDAPTIVDAGDSNATEVGVRFTADSAAYLTGLRFYKASTNTGTHVGHLWSNTGVLLATATFPGETASGWQQGYFSTPVLVSAGTPYVASYFAPNGHYSASSNYFATSGVDNPPLHALENGVSGSNGIYIYTTNGAFPTNTFQSTNYWVDVLYAAQPHNVSGTISGTGGAGATVTINGNTSATTTADSLGNFSFSGIFGGSYTVTPSNAGSVFVPGNQSISISQSDVTGVNFTVPQICPCTTVWPVPVAPTNVDAGDPAAVELGTKIRVDSDGYILGVRFYKAAANTGVHIGNLWVNPSSGSGMTTGTQLSSASFSNESASGWQQVIFAAPVPVTANTTYVASYFAPMGHYSADSAFFANAGVDNPPIHALQNGVDGMNAVFSYGATSSFPSSSFNSDNYWVDAIFAKTTTHTIAGTITGPGAAGATVTLGGSASATTTTDSNGNYSFNGVADGSYTVTPTETSFAFTPASQTVAISGGHNLGVTFTSAAVGYAVSGTVTGAPGITVTLTGTNTLSTTADSSGNFTFVAVPNGNYTMTPAGLGFNVSPSSQNIIVNGAPVSGLTFNATVLVYSISGTISGGAGATVTLTGSTTSSTTVDSSGNYSFTGVNVGTYNIVPSATGLVFTPSNITATVASANITGANFTVLANCPCDTIWPATAIPVGIDSGDGNSVELGVKFRADADAYITGLRFYKASTNIGTHIGHIWSSSGTLLGTATFTNESSSGWQQVLFSSPIPVEANAVYVASYFAPSGHYSADLGYFTSAGVDTPPLHALQNGISGANGVYLYSSMGGFPTVNASNNAINYWVDVIYTPSTTYSIGGSIAGTGGPSATLALSGSSTATVTADASGNFTFNGLANGTYVVTPNTSGFAYTPASQSTTINNGHSLGLSFSSNSVAYTLTGTISGPGGVGATVSLSGASTATTIADGTGAFSFPGLPNGTYAVAVSMAGFVFTPPSQPVIVNGGNTSVAFSSATQTYSVSGTITGVGASGATVQLTGASTATTTSDASGAFTFSGLANGAYTVAVGKTGFLYTPPSQPVSVRGGNASVAFSSTAQTYTLSGTISGAGGNGATVQLTGALTATTTASATGAFAFTGVPNGGYTVTVSKTGFAFTPPSRGVTINGANAVVSFSSAQTFTLTGTITGPGGNGATLQLTGAATATTTANASGGFTFTGLSNGAYTVAVSNVGFVFTPTSRNFTINNANATTSFSSAVQTFNLTGTVSGGGSGVSVKVTGTSTATATTSASGAYSFTALPRGSYTVTPTKTNFIFTPTSQAVTLTVNSTANFTATPVFTLSGTITGAGASGATIGVTGHATATTTTTSSGAYTITGLTAGAYTVTPAKTGFIYTPVNRAVTISNANVTANFSSAAPTFTISGTITGTGASGATVRLTGASTASTTTNSSGVYSFTGVANGSYTVTPTRTGFIYSPTSQAVTVNGANTTANFTSATQTFSITGTISGAGGSGATVKLSGSATATVTANSSGVYTFTGLSNGFYTVTASKSGHTYSPSSQSTFVISANVTGLNFTSR